MNSETHSIKIGLVGNPNCGKTTLFNQLTGSRQKVGNWPGVTVDRKIGKFSVDNKEIQVYDLPGIYSLSVVSNEGSLDELIACKFIMEEKADLIINVVDAANLKRNLFLTLQLLEMGIPCVIAVNMLDVAKSRKIKLDLQKLAELLGCPVLPLVSHRNEGVAELKKVVANFDRKHWRNPDINYFPKKIMSAIENLTALISSENTPQSKNAEWFAIRLLEQDGFVTEALIRDKIVKQAQHHIETLQRDYDEDLEIVMADARYKKISAIVNASSKINKIKRRTITDWIDQVVMNRVLGIPIFLFIMYLMFEFSMNVGTLLQPLFDQGSTTIFVNGTNYLGHLLNFPNWLNAVLANGFGMGINTILTFTPQIVCLFLILSLLEDSGYMARAAFVMDRFMQSIGLPGKSFIPLIVGFGCNVPAIMAARTLESKRDRIMTAMMAPFMSCGARLAIFVVFASAFFPSHGGLIIFILYISGILVAMLTGFILKITVLKGQTAPFVLELPPYHPPHLKNILLLTWQRSKGFIIRAGKIILPVCILLGSLNTIQISGSINSQGDKNSLLSQVGRTITPVFHPLGIEQNNWPATVGLITGTLAKEVVIGTLNTLYTESNQNQANWRDYSLWQGLKSSVSQTISGFKQTFSSSLINPFKANEAEHHMTESAMGNMYATFVSPYAAFAYLLFVLLYIPCISTMGVIAREIGNGWAYLSTFWSFSIAYTVAVIFYQTTRLLSEPVAASSWIVMLILFQAFCYALLRWFSRTKVVTETTQLKPVKVN